MQFRVRTSADLNLIPSDVYALTFDVNVNFYRGFSFPKNLRYLDIETCKITELTELPEFLEQLHCSDNLLETLPKLPGTLKILKCSYNELTELPELPDYLEFLNCSYNKIKSIDKLPKNLRYLRCECNKLTYIRDIPEFLNEFFCGGNFLEKLPKLNERLDVLNCKNNKLTSLPVLPGWLQKLDCQDNRLFHYPSIQIVEVFKFQKQTIENLRRNYILFLGSDISKCLPIDIKKEILKYVLFLEYI